MKPKTNVLLFVEMPSASPSQRDQFRHEMQGRDWLPVPERCDTYCTFARAWVSSLAAHVLASVATWKRKHQSAPQ